MKKTFISLSLLLLMLFTYAQEHESDNWNGLPRHEVFLGVGDCFMSTLHSNYHRGWFVDPYYPKPVDFEDLVGVPTYHGNYYSTPVFSTGYLYRVTKFLWLGGHVNMLGVFGKIYDATDNMEIGNYRETQFSIMPAIRFSYLNKKYVTLYSGISTGYILTAGHDGDDSFVKHSMVNQLTFFGVSAGKNWFGYTEFGIGYKGFVNAGFGYRFNSK